MNSNPFKHCSGDDESLVLGGNLHQDLRDVDSLASGDELYSSSDEEVDIIERYNGEKSNLFRDADAVLFKSFGINILETLAQCLLSGQIQSDDLIIQALSYKCQRILRGRRGIRYKDSWGMYWYAVRNIVKGRGLVPFVDHFEIPSKLSSYKLKMVKLCGLDMESLGKPGLQEQNVKLWLGGKQLEIGTKSLCLSVSIDAKRLSDGAEEDMAELGASPAEIEKELAVTKRTLIGYLINGSRESLFKLYNELSDVSKAVETKVSAITNLITKNTKYLEKTPSLNKYIYILKQQLSVGKDIVGAIGQVQTKVISEISRKRNCLQLLSDGGSQRNFIKISDLSTELELSNIASINDWVKNYKTPIDVPLNEIKHVLGVHLSNIPRESSLCKAIMGLCYLKAENFFRACGLSNERPLQEMKNVYIEARNYSTESIIKKGSVSAITTFCSNFCAITFGNNVLIHEAGIFLNNCILALPDLLVINVYDQLVEYIVIFNEVSDNVFSCPLDLLVNCLISIKISNVRKGGLIVNYSESNFVVFSVVLHEDLADLMIKFVQGYLHAPKCLLRRSKTDLETISSIRSKLLSISESLVTLGSYPLFQQLCATSSQVGICLTELEITELLDRKKKFLARQARELIVCNISDFSGHPSNFPHTVCGATYLSSAVLKVVVRDCLNETLQMIERQSPTAEVLNFGVDGESLHILQTKKNGEPGTLVSLHKLLKKLVSNYKKPDLVQFLSENKRINLGRKNHIEYVEIQDDIIGDDMHIDNDFIENSINDCIASSVGEYYGVFSLDDIDCWLSLGLEGKLDEERKEFCSSLGVSELRNIAIEYIFPVAQKEWLRRAYGSEFISIKLDDKIFSYKPSTVFEKTKSGYFRTITFDMAHISNLLREAAAKDKLKELGLSRESLVALSEKQEFKYLVNIIKLNQNRLAFDPMNQKASALCFSVKTENGLRLMEDFAGAECCRRLRQGIIEALDVTGISSCERIRNICKLKQFLESKLNQVGRKKTASNISNELLQMIHCSLDSHIVSFLNVSHFNVRRKGTLTVEQFFSAITLMADGGNKLQTRQLGDILSRVMLCNALRMTPYSVKGFKFLSMMKVHMTSYTAEETESFSESDLQYPDVFPRRLMIIPVNSFQDYPRRKRRPTLKFNPSVLESESGQVRKFVKKF